MKKGMIEFGWIFSLIIGAIILVLALVFSRTLIQTETSKGEAELVSGLDILLNPFTSVGGTTITLAKNITLPSNTNITFRCDQNYTIGRNIMKVISETVFGKGQGFERNIYNKYIFSPANIQEKKIFVLGKSLEMPFRVDDAIYIIDKPYCFFNAPSDVKEELEAVSVPVKFDSCETGNRKVCFGQTGCDINIASSDDYESGTVTKGKTVYFATRTLLYAAIFSDPDIYRCNVQRLMKRLSNVTDVYIYKAGQISARGCELRDIEVELAALKTASNLAGNSLNPDFAQIFEQAKTVASTNKLLECPVF